MYIRMKILFAKNRIIFGLRFYRHCVDVYISFVSFQKCFKLKDINNKNEIELYFFVRINIQEHNKI